VVRIPLSAVKCAKFAINVANVRVVDVAINDIGNDFTPPAFKSMLLRHLTTQIGKLPQLVEWQMIQVQGILGRDPVSIQNFIN